MSSDKHQVDWKAVSLPSSVESNDLMKNKLNEFAHDSLFQGLKLSSKKDVDDVMVEYVVVMLLNNKNLKEISEALKDIIDEKDAIQVCQALASKLSTLLPPKKHAVEVSKPVSGESSHQSNMEPISTKDLREARRKRILEEKELESSENPSKIRDTSLAAPATGALEIISSNVDQALDQDLIQAYKLFLESSFKGGFLEYQLFLSGKLSRPKIALNPKAAPWQPKSVSTLRQVESDIENIERGSASADDIAAKRESIQRKLKKMTYVREDLKFEKSVNPLPDENAESILANKPKTGNKIWVRPGTLPEKLSKKISETLDQE